MNAPADFQAVPSEAGGAFSALASLWRGFKNQHAAFLVACLYLIFEYNRPQMIYPALNVIPWGKTLLFVGLALSFSDQSSRPPPSKAVRPLLVFSLTVLLSMIFAYSPTVAAREWSIYFSWVVTVLVVVRVVSTRARLLLFVAVYFLVNLKMAHHGFRSWCLSGFGYSGWGVSGSPGWFQNSGEFSMEMVVFLPLVLSYIMTYYKQWPFTIRAFYCGASLVIVASVVASSSRGGVIGLIAVAVWCLACSKRRIKALLILGIASCLAYHMMPLEFRARFATAGEDKTSLSRLFYWECGKEAVRDHPFVGIGFRNWSLWIVNKHPEVLRQAGNMERVEAIHNTFFEAATELGLVGAAVYVGMLLQILFTNVASARVARARDDPFLAATATGLVGSLIGYLLPSCFMSVLYYPYVWILLAMTVSVSTISRSS